MFNCIRQTKCFRSTLRVFNKFFPVFVAKLRFRKIFGRKLNLRNPKDINEKILWLSLFSDTSLWTMCADKLAVREYVKEKMGGDDSVLVELYGAWERAEEIDWESLPSSFVLKSNNASGTVMIVSEKSDLDIETTTNCLNDWLKKSPSGETTEFHYKGIKPCIIAERLLEPSEDEKKFSTSIIDYKCWCFNGKIDSIWTCINRNKEGTEVALFSPDWVYRPEASVFNYHYREQKHLVPRPACLDEMIRIAETLSEPFPVVRVDLYVVGERVYFGELTFTSLGGTMNFYTDEELLRMGKKIDLSGVKRNK